MTLALCCRGCISNDLPLPLVPAGITEMDVEGATSVSIDADHRTVSIVLSEQTDRRRVNIRSITFNDERVEPSWDLTGEHDLTQDLKLTLHIFEDYIWEIKVSQPIERYFTIDGQVGSSWIDDANYRVMVSVSSSADLTRLNVNSCKLGPAEITTYSPEPNSIHDFSSEAELTLSYHDLSERWTIYVEPTDMAVRFDSIDPWTGIAWLKASGTADRDNGFRYRRVGESEWSSASNVQSNGGAFSASIDGLQPLTEYECQAYSGEDYSEVKTFCTEQAMALPNGSFETFSHAESGKYYSFYDPASADPMLQSKWWCSGNKGSTTVGSSHTITMPDATSHVDGDYSLKLDSDYVVIKFAAGNIFTGEYYETLGTSGGIIRMGRPFTLRPQKLTVWLKYHRGVITDKTFGDKPAGDPTQVGDYDRGVVWVALGDWDYHQYGGSADSPIALNTTDKSTFFKNDSEQVIAYGEYVVDHDIDQWTKVEIPLNYTSTSRKPTHIIITASSSKLGDYFTGSPDSVMWLDDMRLEY